ncbi:MAG: ABC transporter permease [Pyrinomonadaceae bacterium]
MGTLWQDMKYGLRMLLRRPGFTVVAVLALALGIGANTAIFSLVYATLLRPLPVAAPERLVYLFTGPPDNPYNVASYPDYVDLRDQSQSFDGLIARGGITVSLRNGEQPAQVSGLVVSGNYFDVLGVHAARGRTFTAEEGQTPGKYPVVVISHGLWQRMFGGDSNIVGRQVALNGQQFTIVGVAPQEFKGTESDRVNDIYVPMMMQSVVRPPRGGYSGEMNPDLLNTRGNRWLLLVGRLKPGVTIEQAQAEITTVMHRQGEAHPDTNRGRIGTLSFVSQGDPEQRGALVSAARLLLGVVGLVLLIACANVANLLLARATARRKEIAVRLALGAGRLRLVRQLLTESVLLALLGGGLGLLLAVWLTDLLAAVPPPPGVLPIRPEFSFDRRVLLFTCALSLLTGLVFGLVPALQASRPDLVSALKDESVPLDERRRLNARSLLVIAQVALSLVLLVGAGLFLRSLQHAQAISTGFDANKILVAPLSVNLLRYTRPQGREFYRQTVERVRALPGVEAASVARLLPLGGGSSTRGLLIAGQTNADTGVYRNENGSPEDNPNTISVNTIGDSYFQTMGIALVRGRDFDARDAEDRPPVVIVNETFVRRHLAGQEPLGQRLSFRGAQGPWVEIVGVARDSKYRTLGENPTPFAYLPLAQNHETGVTLLVRTKGEPAALAGAVRREVQQLEPNLPLTDIEPVTQVIGEALYPARMGALLLTGFGLLAVVLAAVGLYGVMSFVVSRRTREIGIRIALGAQTGAVLRLVLGQSMALVAAGIVLGLIAATMATRVLASFLYGVGTRDAVTFTLAPLALLLVALLASYVPARRATKVDPVVALRHE